MRIADVGGRTLVLHFLHYEQHGHKHTMCTIFDEEGERRIAIGIGVARCGKRDMFVKRVGRKIALQKALHDTPFTAHDRNHRARVWRAYFAVSRP